MIMTTKLTTLPIGTSKEHIELGFLTPDQIAMIDKALLKVGEFGEVRLILEKRCLRFIVLQQSYDVRSWQAEKS
jgi:hypothetical protein